MNPAVLNSLAADNPIRKLYRKAIDAAQGGKPDNDAKQFRYYVLHQLVQYAVKRFPSLNLVECGCWHGHSTLLIAHLMQASGYPGRLHVFDSFKGLSEFKPQDRSDTFNTTAKREAERVHYASDIHKLRRLVEPFGFVELHKGWIPDVFEDVPLGSISFAMIDVDLYEPTLASLRRMYPRLMMGGAIFLDDYGYRNFPGAKIAVDEFLREHEPTLFIENPMGSAYLVK
jgi:O-methyltransferase